MNLSYYKVILFLTLVGLVGCGGSSGGGDGGGGGGGSVSISATVGSDYTIAYKPSLFEKAYAGLFGTRALALGSGTTVDQVVAVPSWQGNFGGSMLSSIETADIADDGSFSLSLDRSYDWVLLLVNSQATSLSEKVVSYVSTSVTAEDTLVAYSGNSLQSNLELGVLSQADDEATGQYNAASFDLTLDQITAVAQADEGYKHMINVYLNYNSNTGIFYTVQPIFNWNAGSVTDYDAQPTPNALNGYILDGFTIDIETNNVTNPLPLDEVCSGDVSIGLYPPSAIMDGSANTYDTVNGIVNDASGYDTNFGDSNSDAWFQNGRYYCYDNDFGMSYFGGQSVLYGFHGVLSSLQVPAGGMPNGHWLLTSGASTIAEFDLDVSAPMDELGNFTVPLPVVKVNHAADGAITSISVTWYLYDTGTMQYAQLSAAQISAINTLLRDSFIEVQDEDGPDINNPETISLGGPNYSDGLISSIDLSTASPAWYFPGSTGDVSGNLVSNFIKIGLHLGGLEYQFVWNN